jgi:hypothetical protein
MWSKQFPNFKIFVDILYTIWEFFFSEKKVPSSIDFEKAVTPGLQEGRQTPQKGL